MYENRYNQDPKEYASTTGSEHKIRLEKLQTQTEALFNEIFQSLDSGDAQIED